MDGASNRSTVKNADFRRRQPIAARIALLASPERLLMCAADTTHSWGDSGIVWEDQHDVSQAAIDDRESADESAVRGQKIGSAERDKVVLILAQILMQAAGLNVEELEDDKL
jgi:hypothetical protein